MVLDVIHRIQATQASDLACRWNCKAGKCGSCSAEINGKPRLMCMTRMDTFQRRRADHGRAHQDLPADQGPGHRRLLQLREGQDRSRAVQAAAGRADGTCRMQQEDVDRIQEFRKCIECFLCQDVCHVIRDHEEKKTAFAGPRFFIELAELEMHPLDTLDRRELIRDEAGIGFCNITKCCTEVCPEHIHITDNAIIPLKERVVDEYYDPVVWVLRKLRPRRQEVDARSHEDPRVPGQGHPAGVRRAGAAAARWPTRRPRPARSPQRLGGRVVVKAQVHAGGRGKARRREAGRRSRRRRRRRPRQILGMMLKTPQTAARGHQGAQGAGGGGLADRHRALPRRSTLDRGRGTPRGHGLAGRRHGHRGGRGHASREDHPRVDGSRRSGSSPSRRASSPSGSGSPASSSRRAWR